MEAVRQHPSPTLRASMLARVGLDLKEFIMSSKKTASPGLYGRRSFHVRGLDPFAIKAIKYLAWARGGTHAEIIEWLIDDDLINTYRDLARTRDLEQFQREIASAQHDIEMEPTLGGEG